jgi:thiamine-monophosphate kinase
VKLKDLGEDGLIARIRNRFPDSNAIIGIGDDATVLEVPAGHSLVYCSDLVAEGTHFLRESHPADSIGYKAVAVNVSDVGAMGGIPTHFLISFAAPGDLEIHWIDGFLDGIEKACRDFAVSLAGGDSAAAGHIFVDVSMVGKIATGSAVRRSGAQPGDRIYVTGSLGGSALGLEHLLAGDLDHPSVRRHLYPSPRHAVGSAVAPYVHAMIDVSDGLSTDLSRVLKESAVSARIHRDRVPKAPGSSDAQALHGGEEYELLIVAPELPDHVGGIPLACIGEVIAAQTGEQLLLVEDGGKEYLLKPEGYRHFS